MIFRERQEDSEQSLNEKGDKIGDLDFKRFIQPPNPITKKVLKEDEVKISSNNMNFVSSLRFQRKKETQYEEQLCLGNFYNKDFLIFQKYQNSNKNIRNSIKYLASFFIDDVNYFGQCSKYIGMIKQDAFVEFNSNYQSANLFLVFKTGDKQYDLVLQNDLNTTGYAQWFNFKVKNKVKNVAIKINIINLYKSSSLYQKGMKPLSFSKYDSKWQRNAFQVNYYENSIPTQRDPTKHYNTLSFFYQFKYQQDEVQFCHFYPYTSIDCQNFLENINGSAKVRIKNLGNSSLKKTIPLIHICSDTKLNKFKRSIVLIGRQHSGQTQSSYLIQQFVYFLLGNSKQSEFILDKFDIYICPMLNIDGVSLGNYRTNAFGYDLNRYWHLENQLKMPEIYYFKKFINNLKKRSAISLILDLHGHSKKQNSFFYGNPYGKNFMMLPFIASKMCQMIKFKSCTFNQQKSEKSRTARAILGNMFGDQTYVYTFQISFWGYRKNNRIYPYSLQNLKQFSRVLFQSIYKVFLQEIKEEITLKQSVFFKQIKKQLTTLNDNYFQKQSCSDSQAEKLIIKEDNQRQKNKIKFQKNDENDEKKQMNLKYREVAIQANLDFNQNNLINEEVFIKMKLGVQKGKKQKEQKLNVNSHQRFILESLNNRAKKLKSLMFNNKSLRKVQQKKDLMVNSNQSFSDYGKVKVQQLYTTSRKHFLMQKLRICGETFTENLDVKSFKSIQGKINIQIQVSELSWKEMLNTGKDEKYSELQIEEQKTNKLIKNMYAQKQKHVRDMRRNQMRRKNNSVNIKGVTDPQVLSYQKYKNSYNFISERQRNMQSTNKGKFFMSIIKQPIRLYKINGQGDMMQVIQENKGMQNKKMLSEQQQIKKKGKALQREQQGNWMKTNKIKRSSKQRDHTKSLGKHNIEKLPMMQRHMLK